MRLESIRLLPSVDLKPGAYPIRAATIDDNDITIYDNTITRNG